MKIMLEQERINRGLTRVQLAKTVGLSSEAIRLIETGKRKPSYDVLVKLLDLFGYEDPRKLFAEVPEPQISTKVYIKK